MKRLILLMLVVLFSLPTFAQQTKNLFEQLTDLYADKDGFSASQISNDMFDLYLKKNNIDEDSPITNALNDLNSIMVISQSKFTAGAIVSSNAANKSEENKNLLHQKILDHYKDQNYTLLKTEKRMGEDVKVYLRKNQDNIESLALITNSSSATGLVELQGLIDLKTVSELSKTLNLRGLEKLYKIDNNNASFFSGSSAYKEFFGQERMEEMVARQREMAERQNDLTKEQRVQMEEQIKLQAQKQLEMAEKYREMAEKYRRQPIFLSSPGDTNTVYYIDGKKVKAKKIKELDKEKIESVEVNKAKKDDDKTTIRIKTK